MPIHGWDASDFDWGRGRMDLGAAVRDGIVFFTHKATEGTRIQHVHYGDALNRARAAGMPCMGAYMIPRTPGNNGHGPIAQQVSYFLAYLNAQTPWWRSTPEFFIQVDSEHWGYDDVAPQYGAQACALLRAQTGKWVIHYAPRWAYGDTIPGGEPLWASSYGTNPAVPYRQAYPGDNSSGWAPYSGRVPMFLQYGSQLTIGSQPGCDANAFRGTLDQLRALITGSAMPQTSPERGPSMIQVKQAGGPTIVLTDWSTWCDRTTTYEQLEAMRTAGMVRIDVPDPVLQRILALPQPERMPQPQAGGAPTQEQTNTAVLAAMLDPRVQKGIGDAIAGHVKVV